jgi:ATP-dependent RNA helicase RhlE
LQNLANTKIDINILRVLIVVPTRELVDQISIAISSYGKYLKIRHTKIYGGSSKTMQLKKLATGIDIVVATPGRLKDFVENNQINLSSIKTIVLDEVDTMLEFGFLKDIEYLLPKCSKQRHIMMFSATISQNIKKLAKEFLYNPVTIEVSQRRDIVNLIKHRAIKVDLNRKNELLAHIIKNNQTLQILVFVNLKQDINNILLALLDKNINAACLHGDIQYKQRSKNIKSFKSKKIHVLITTDIAARGIDIENLNLVINFDLPNSTDDFTHRVGRTGRAGNHGLVITILTVKDYNNFTKIQKNLKLDIKREIELGFDLKDRQPRQKRMKKVLLSNKKGKNQDKQNHKSKKITKRDKNRDFR